MKGNDSTVPADTKQ